MRKILFTVLGFPPTGKHFQIDFDVCSVSHQILSEVREVCQMPRLVISRRTSNTVNFEPLLCTPPLWRDLVKILTIKL
jgi:hypothetical protein